MKSIRASVMCLAMALVAWVQPGFAQTVTTGTLNGVVTDQQGGVLPGATVTAVHTPTGTTYEGVTQQDGRFSLLNVRVGAPYRVTVELPSFRTSTLDNVVVALGEATQVSLTMQLAAVFSETVTVVAEVSPVFTASKTGATENIETELIETLPT